MGNLAVLAVAAVALVVGAIGAAGYVIWHRAGWVFAASTVIVLAALAVAAGRVLALKYSRTVQTNMMSLAQGMRRIRLTTDLVQWLSPRVHCRIEAHVGQGGWPA